MTGEGREATPEIMVCGCCGQAMGHARLCATVISLNPHPERVMVPLSEYRKREAARRG